MKNLLALCIGLMVALPTVCSAQQSGNQSAPAASGSNNSAPAFTTQELEQLVAPIALYPDQLVSQIFMASTYPIEVIEAERWVTQNSSLTGDALAKALDQQKWDPSVKSLVNFPDVLKQMSDKLDWLTKLGNAFVAQQSDVLAAVQTLRRKAQAQGNLQSNSQQNVTEQPASGSQQQQTIVIQPASQDVVYVPTYNPSTVYGTWPYPSYPPYSYYPPGYSWGTAALSFGAGVACGAAWGYAWGNCDWDNGDIKINNSTNINYNRNLQNTQEFRNAANGTWNHDAAHRGGAAYADSATALRYGQGANSAVAQARENYRGYADQGREQLQRGDYDRAGNYGAQRDRANAQQNYGQREAAQNRAQQGNYNRDAANRGSYGGGNYGNRSSGSAMDRSAGGGYTRDASNRGYSSRGGGSYGGGSRGGGFSRGGGGGRRR